MVIRPRIRGFICTTAHPEGCAAGVRAQIDAVRQDRPARPPRCALVIGASTGYGLSSRIAAAFGGGAATVGVFLERPAKGERTATAGWYNSVAFHHEAQRAGLFAESLNGDAFSHEMKNRAVERIREGPGEVDLVVYSLASPRRTHPDTGEVFRSTLKPIGEAYSSKTIDVQTGEVSEVEIEAATEDEVAQTIAVMGGDDWELWIDALERGGVLAPSALTVAYSYLGPQLTYPIYRHGTIGRAKDHLETTARALDERLGNGGGGALISVNKAVVTQSSAAIPVVPLYISLLFRVMKERGIHEGTAEQMRRLFAERLFGEGEPPTDEDGRVRLDDLEMRADVQEEVERRWRLVDSDNVSDLADLEGYRTEFLRLFGFSVDGVDYDRDVLAEVEPPEGMHSEG